jgi:hypothetical protein
VLPGDREPGRAVRRPVRRRRAHDRRVLPSELSFSGVPEAAKRDLLPDDGGCAAGGAARLQAVPTRRDSGLTRVGYARRSRGTGDAVDRGRRRRPRRCGGAGSPARGQHAAPPPVARRGGGRAAARARPFAARPDGGGADRADGSPVHGDRVRRRLHQRQAVQRDDPAGIRRFALGAPASSPR